MEESSEQEIDPLCNFSEDVVGVLPERRVTNFSDLSEETNLNDSEAEEKFSNLSISETDTGKTEDAFFDCGTEELNIGECDAQVPYPKECPPGEVEPDETETICSSDDLDASVGVTQESATHLATNDRLSELQNSKDKFTTLNSTCILSDNKETDSLSSTVGLANETSGISDKDVTRIAGKAADFYTSGHLLTGEELLAYFQWLHQAHIEEAKQDPDALTVVGLVS